MNSKEKWNDAASDYQTVFRNGMNDYSRSMMTFLTEQNMVQPGCRVLDVGCGVGKYGTYFAAMGCDVTLTDLSSGMLEMAKQNMARFSTPFSTLECDFTEVSADHPVFARGFDLSISTMCPAIHDVETVRKLSSMTHGWCFITHFTNWEEPIRKAFFDRLGVAPQEDMNHFRDHIDRLYAAVAEAGYEPHICHVPYGWSDNRTAEEAATHLLKRLDDVEITEALRQKAIDAAASLCNADNVFVDSVETTVAWVWWNTKGA